MNPILQSNQSSAVVATVNESTTKNPWIYNEKDRLTVPHALQVLPIAPSAGSTAPGSTVTFEVAKNGIAMGFWLKLEAGAELTGTGKHFGILECIDEITLNTSGRVVERLDRFQLMARYRSLPRVRQDCMIQELTFGKTVPSGDTLYVWLPFYMYRDPHRYGVMTNFEEPHHIDVRFTSYSNANQLKDTSTELLVHYRQLDESRINEIVSKNYGDGMLSRLVGISKREPIHRDTPPSAGGDSSVQIELTENDAVRSIYLMVTANEKLAEIKKVKLTFNNTDVIDCDAKFISAFASNWDMTDGDNIEHIQKSADANNLKYVMRLDLGHGDDSDLRNVVAFRELSNPTLSLTYTGTGQTEGESPNVVPIEHSVHVIYETASFLTTSADTGRVQLSLSS